MRTTQYGPLFKFSSSIPLAGDGVADDTEAMHHAITEACRNDEGETPTIGYGASSEVSPELEDVMRQNSEAVDEMMVTAKQRGSVDALIRAIEKQGAGDAEPGSQEEMQQNHEAWLELMAKETK